MIVSGMTDSKRLKADLHLHTLSSDGKNTPTETLERVRRQGCGLAAITDHDTVDGVDEALCSAQKLGMICVSGIELSAYQNGEIHILGYCFDYKNPEFIKNLANVKGMRRCRNLKLKQKLEELGIFLDIDFEAENLGRKQIAEAMVRQSVSASVSDAFERYLGKDKKAYVAAERLSPVQAVAMIKRFGGAASLAHPKAVMQSGQLVPLLKELKEAGLDGMEVYYPNHGDRDILRLKQLCGEYGLIATGGSDYHGEDERKINYVAEENVLRRFGILL